ncbi:hypothetical protein J3R30DRAFT_3772371 [Lentinula aciculospora]|uniref:Uncharacterized protein n=1 Tax=Lentinula aciculospora TaxID=153920 RepID=A0A9W9A6A4_9AGAR|nr:hypothetical protein J3R30DRAFT_3772371 [Lentinula aciculospora]
MRSAVIGLAVGLWVTTTNAHVAAFTKGMWCLNGAAGNNLNSDDPVLPLYMLDQSQWWFHAENGCNNQPPADGDFMTLPAGESITLELAANQGVTSLSFNGQYATDWVDGNNYPDNYDVPTCITTPNLHTQNQSMAAGTALAIAYTSDVSSLKPEDLVVFSVAYNTPWKRLTTYDIPASLPACPEGGCICAWGWIPNACGEANMYFEGIRCQVTPGSDPKPLGTPQPAVWCEDDTSKCVTGPKQMLFWHQASGDNIEVDGLDLAGEFRSPGYNAKCGFSDGAQNDIFDESGTASSYSSSSSSTSGVASTSSSSSSAAAATTSAAAAVAVNIANPSSDSASSSSTSTTDSTTTATDSSSTESLTSSPTDTWISTSTDSWTSTADAATSSTTDTSPTSAVAAAAATTSSSSGARQCKRREPHVAKRNVDHRAASVHRRNAHKHLDLH